MSESIFSKELSNARILNRAGKLSPRGQVHHKEKYCYLKVDDNYIHDIYPLLSGYGQIQKPDYFKDGVGAHISIIYPEEGLHHFNYDTGIEHEFSVVKFVKTRFQSDMYYVLVVDAPTLSSMREQHQLDARPTFKQQKIFFHITIGVEPCYLSSSSPPSAKSINNKAVR